MQLHFSANLKFLECKFRYLLKPFDVIIEFRQKRHLHQFRNRKFPVGHTGDARLAISFSHKQMQYCQTYKNIGKVHCLFLKSVRLSQNVETIIRACYCRCLLCRIGALYVYFPFVQYNYHTSTQIITPPSYFVIANS